MGLNILTASFIPENWLGDDSFLHSIKILQHSTGAETVSFSVDCLKQVNLICGKSGVGKTSVLSHICNNILCSASWHSSDQCENSYDYYNDVLFTDFEHYILQALQILNPTIERVAWLHHHSRSGLVARAAGQSDKIHLRDLGTGSYYIAHLVMMLSHPHTKVLLADDIMSTIHESNLMDLWSLIFEIMFKRNIQLFATTSSRFCLEGCAVAARHSDVSKSTCIFRLDYSKSRKPQSPVFLSLDEVITGIKNNINLL
jgi:AAA15 family ATPase/GTPase